MYCKKCGVEPLLRIKWIYRLSYFNPLGIALKFMHNNSYRSYQALDDYEIVRPFKYINPLFFLSTSISLITYNCACCDIFPMRSFEIRSQKQSWHTDKDRSSWIWAEMISETLWCWYKVVKRMADIAKIGVPYSSGTSRTVYEKLDHVQVKLSISQVNQPI